MYLAVSAVNIMNGADYMPEKYTDKLQRLFYKRNAWLYGAFFSMGVWMMDESPMTEDTGWLMLIKVFVLGLGFALLCDQLIYLYDRKLELAMSKLINDEGRLLPSAFETDRLILREIRPGDWRLIKALSRDETIGRFVDDIDANMSLQGARRWVIDHMSLERHTLRCTRIIELKETEEAVGAVVFINGHELEYWIHASQRESGIGYEAVCAAIDRIETVDGTVLFAKCHKENEASAFLLEKLGFEEYETDCQKRRWILENQSK